MLSVLTYSTIQKQRRYGNEFSVMLKTEWKCLYFEKIKAMHYIIVIN